MKSPTPETILAALEEDRHYPITESVVSLLGFVMITKFFKTTGKE